MDDRTSLRYSLSIKIANPIVNLNANAIKRRGSTVISYKIGDCFYFEYDSIH